MPNKRSEKNEYRVTGSVLDELGLDRQATLELKLKAALHQNILQLVKRRGYRARDLERILQIQQPRVSELMRGKLSTLSVARLLLYADLLGAEAEVKFRRARRPHAGIGNPPKTKPASRDWGRFVGSHPVKVTL